MSPKAAFIDRLVTLGIPVTGVSGPDSASIVIQFGAGATAQQRTQAASEAASFDWAAAIAAAATAAADSRSELAALKAIAQSALTQIETDLTTLGGSPTNAQVVAIVNRTIQRQRAIIKAMRWLV